MKPKDQILFRIVNPYDTKCFILDDLPVAKRINLVSLLSNQLNFIKASFFKNISKDVVNFEGDR
jgi:hypothetical protein